MATNMKPHEHEVPECTSPLWEQVTVPILDELKKGPRSINDLRKLNIRWLINGVAWLEWKRKIRYDCDIAGVWRIVGDERPYKQ